MPALTASSTAYWIKGLAPNGSISLGEAFVAGRKRVPRPAAGMMALETFREGISSEFYGPVPAKVKRTRESSNRLFPFTSRGAICRISSIFCDVSTKPSMNGRRLPLCRERIGKRSEEHTSELQSLAYLVCRLLLEKKNNTDAAPTTH